MDSFIVGSGMNGPLLFTGASPALLIPNVTIGAIGAIGVLPSNHLSSFHKIRLLIHAGQAGELGCDLI